MRFTAKPRKLFLVFFLGLLAWSFSGCATSHPRSSLHLSGDPLIDGPIAIAQGPPEDRLLWKYRMAAAALRRGKWDLARGALDDAVQRLQNLFGPDPRAKKARSLFGRESQKFFVGEPYERVMAWYYRGILYWRDGEPDNARACFRSAQLMDAYAEDQEYVADYVLLDYLDGLITEKLGGDGKPMYERARKHARLAIPPPINPHWNVFFFLEYGKGPLKYATGTHREQLRFLPGVSKAKEVKIYVDHKAVHVGPYDDLYYQATTRGGRPIDYILGRKAVFKDVTDVGGTGAMVSGVILATRRRTQEVGLALLAAGLLSKVVSAAVHPEADTRTWDNLPLYLSFAAFQLPPGRYTARVEFLDKKRRVLPDLTKEIHFEVVPGKDKVLFVSDQSITPMEQ